MDTRAAFAAAALAVDLQTVCVPILNVDPVYSCALQCLGIGTGNSGYHAPALQNTHIGHTADVNQPLRRGVLLSVEEFPQLDEQDGGGIG